MTRSISGGTITALTAPSAVAAEQRSERLSPLASAVLWLTAAAIVGGWMALAIIHVRDDYRVTHVQGIWIAIADAARRGALYPPIFDGEHYSGTRYLPLPLIANGLAAAAAGDPLVGGKELAALLMAVMLALVYRAIHSFDCPAALAAALSAVVVATDTGLQAGTTIGGDLLPAVLQVAALTMAIGHPTRTRLLTAAGFAGLGIAAKITGAWAFLSIATWLLLAGRRRDAALFASVSALAAAAALGAVQLITHGGLWTQLTTFAAAGVHGPLALLRGPNQVLYNLLGHASAAVVLMPLAFVAMLSTPRVTQLPIVAIAFGYAAAFLLVVYADVGTGFNQMVDIVALTVLTVGYLAGRSVRGVSSSVPVSLLAIAVTVIWAAGLDLVRTVGFDLRGSIAALRSSDGHHRGDLDLAQLIRADEDVLAEDPSISVALGRRPVVMDPFMVMGLDRVHPDLVDPLVAWVSAERFDLVVLVVSLDDRSFDYWWSNFHFGQRVADALRRHYRFERSVGRYFLYRPTRRQ
jgi:hypothetical protein